MHNVTTHPVKSVRVNIMLPADVMEAIGRITTNRSRFLADAAREKVGAA